MSGSLPCAEAATALFPAAEGAAEGSCTAVVTGASRGIGSHIAMELASRGYPVIAACRNPDRARIALGDPSGLRFVRLDLSSFDDAREGARNVIAASESIAAPSGRIGLLVNNAGISFGRGAVSPDGYELAIQTNFLSTALFTMLLEPALRASDRPAIINVGSAIHSASGWKLLERRMAVAPAHRPDSRGVLGGAMYYAASKFALAAWTAEYARRSASWGLRVALAHPGVADTGIMYAGDWSDGIVRAIVRPFLVDVKRATANVLAALDVLGAMDTGESGFSYVSGGKPATLPRRALDTVRAGRLFDLVRELSHA